MSQAGTESNAFKNLALRMLQFKLPVLLHLLSNCAWCNGLRQGGISKKNQKPA
jgi:hypothetical protein